MRARWATGGDPAAGTKKSAANRLTASPATTPIPSSLHDAGLAFRERGFMAGKLGKTLAGSAEAAMHLRQIPRLVEAACRTSDPRARLRKLRAHRDGVQRLIIGNPRDEAPGTLLLRRSACLVCRNGVSDAPDGCGSSGAVVARQQDLA